MRRPRSFVFKQARRFGGGGLFHKAFRVFKRSQQLFDCAAQLRVRAAGIIKKLLTFLRLQLLRRVKQTFDFLPLLRVWRLAVFFVFGSMHQG
jgi:hypothetical protein